MKTDRRKYSKLKGLHNDRNDRIIGLYKPFKINALNHFYKCHAEDVTTTITTIHKDH